MVTNKKNQNLVFLFIFIILLLSLDSVMSIFDNTSCEKLGLNLSLTENYNLCQSLTYALNRAESFNLNESLINQNLSDLKQNLSLLSSNLSDIKEIQKDHYEILQENISDIYEDGQDVFKKLLEEQSLDAKKEEYRHLEEMAKIKANSTVESEKSPYSDLLSALAIIQQIRSPPENTVSTDQVAPNQNYATKEDIETIKVSLKEVPKSKVSGYWIILILGLIFIGLFIVDKKFKITEKLLNPNLQEPENFKDQPLNKKFSPEDSFIFDTYDRVSEDSYRDNYVKNVRQK